MFSILNIRTTLINFMQNVKTLHLPIVGMTVRLAFIFVMTLISGNTFAIGAIAIDQTSLKSGISWNASTKQEANRLAMSSCKTAQCEIVTNFENQCAAVAMGTNGSYGYMLSATISQARKVALETCKKYEGINCSIVLSQCDPEYDTPKAVAPPKPAAPPAPSAAEIKRQKCIRLGLAPGTSDYAQCIN